MRGYKYCTWVFICFSFFSCTKETGNNISIVGFVKLVDENGVELINREGVFVKAKTASSSGTTDLNGRFQLNKLVAGNVYSLEFSKESYGTVSTNTPKFVGDQKPGLISNVTMYQIPTASLINPSIQNQNNVLTVKGEVSPFRDNYLYVMAYANDSLEVSETHYDYKTWDFNPAGGGTYQNPFSLNIYLDNNTYVAGTTLYISIYFYNPLDYGSVRSSGKKVGNLQIKL